MPAGEAQRDTRAWMRDGFRDLALFRESFARARAHELS